MNQRIDIRDVSSNQPIAQTFVLAQASLGQSRNGPFWKLVLQDAVGSIEAKIWSPQSNEYSDLAAGQIVFVEGLTSSFRDRVEVKVDRLRLIAPDEEVDLAELMRVSEVPPETLLANLEELLRRHLHYPPWRKLTSKVLTTPEIRQLLLMAPGGKAIHHAYIGGLLEHTLSVCQLCLGFAEQYSHLDGEILLTAAAFHDLGKAWELSSGLVADYTDRGRLLGHILIGLEVLAPFMKSCGAGPELLDHLRHIIISHHGEYAYGSPKMPMTGEAMALHYADNLDSKMNQVASAFEEVPEPGGWTSFQRSLDRFLYRPVPTPGQERPKNGQTAKEDQCSLPLKA